jgi:tripeptidyl-peptidase-1
MQLISFVCCAMLSLATSHWEKMDEARAPNMGSFSQQRQASENDVLDLVFIIKPKNTDELERIVLDVSNPKSPNYGKHMTKIDIDNLTINREGIEAFMNYVSRISDLHVTRSVGGHIHATASVKSWQELLNTKFYVFTESERNQSVVRTTEYYLPVEIATHVECVLNTVQFPTALSNGPIVRNSAFKS